MDGYCCRVQLIMKDFLSHSFLQTVHIESATLKTEMRGHDNRIECTVFVHMVSIPAIRELVALVTKLLLLNSKKIAKFLLFFHFLLCSPQMHNHKRSIH